ncbi:MAG TPA: hypothetical protein VFD39_08085 [Trueperaceae bacterium]|nr:hypothetical protein [Trueperaceae bacterium]
MYSATVDNDSANSGEVRVDNDRVLGVYGIILGALPALFILVFWSMGAKLLITDNGGYINQLQLTGAWRWLYFSYPVVLLGSMLLALGAFVLNRYKEAAGLAMLPFIGTVAYYLALVQLR